MSRPQIKWWGMFLLVMAVAAMVVVLFWRRVDEDPAPAGTVDDGAESTRERPPAPKPRSKADAREARLRALKRMKAVLERNAKQGTATSALGDGAAGSTDAEPLRQSTIEERRRMREGIVLDSIFRMKAKGAKEKALVILDQQRAIFPGETPMESEAFERLSDCISADPKGKERAAAFLSAHPDFRLNSHIRRLCEL